MFDIFEQPWTMLGVAIISMIIIFVFRCVWPNKERWWQLVIPLLIALLGFGVEYFVKTDLEQITSLMKAGIAAVETKNPQGIGPILSDSYRDSSGRGKTELVAYCDAVLSQNIVKTCKKMSLKIDIASKTTATADLTMIVTFDKTAMPELEAVPFFNVKVKLYFQKESDKKWRIGRSELVELNKQTFKWGDIH